MFFTYLIYKRINSKLYPILNIQFLSKIFFNIIKNISEILRTSYDIMRKKCRVSRITLLFKVFGLFRKILKNQIKIKCQ